LLKPDAYDHSGTKPSLQKKTAIAMEDVGEKKKEM
jgi:hypothetical protein